jgi:hypothetical protein
VIHSTWEVDLTQQSSMVRGGQSKARCNSEGEGEGESRRAHSEHEWQFMIPGSRWLRRRFCLLGGGAEEGGGGGEDEASPQPFSDCREHRQCTLQSHYGTTRMWMRCTLRALRSPQSYECANCGLPPTTRLCTCSPCIHPTLSREQRSTNSVVCES